MDWRSFYLSFYWCIWMGCWMLALFYFW